MVGEGLVRSLASPPSTSSAGPPQGQTHTAQELGPRLRAAGGGPLDPDGHGGTGRAGDRAARHRPAGMDVQGRATLRDREKEKRMERLDPSKETGSWRDGGHWGRDGASERRDRETAIHRDIRCSHREAQSAPRRRRD